MKREEQIRSTAFYASMTEETIVREEVIKDGVHVGYKDVKLRDSDRPIARLFFMEGVKWADSNQPSQTAATYLVACDSGKYYDFANYIKKDKKCYWVYNDNIIRNVTHWMPIPEL